MPGSVHVVLGDSALYTLVAALRTRRDEVVCLRDVLSCRPLREMRDPESWSAARLSFWNSVEQTIDGPTRRRRRRNEDGTLLVLFGDHRPLLRADEVVVWLATGRPSRE